jgi:hypothetical protein
MSEKEEILLDVRTKNNGDVWLYRDNKGDWLLEIEETVDPSSGVVFITIPAKELWNELAAKIAEE